MDHAGYSWTVQAMEDEWRWAIHPPLGGAPIVSGAAPSRAVAAAMVIRAIARGMTAQQADLGTLAA